MGCAACGGRCGAMGMGSGDVDCQCRFRASTAAGAPALQGLGATGTSMTPPIAQIPSAGASQAVADLQLEVNRFHVGGVDLPVNGLLDRATAFAAMMVVQKRANDAFVQYAGQGAGGSTSIGDLLRDVNSGFGNPIGWIQNRVPEVTQIISLYGDAKGLPKARQSFTGIFDRLKDPKVLAVLGAVAVGLILRGRR